MLYTAIAYNYPHDQTVQLVVIHDHIDQCARAKLKCWLDVESKKCANILNVATNLPMVDLTNVLEATPDVEQSLLDSILESET
jgi:hypothetical protein